jgi:hypothetical protein
MHAPDSPTSPRISGSVRPLDERTREITADGSAIELVFDAGLVFLLDGTTDDELFVLPGDAAHPSLAGHGVCWVLPESPTAAEPGWLLRADGAITATTSGSGRVTVRTDAPVATLVAHRARPHADVTGGEFALGFEGGAELADAMAGFSWGTMLPSIIERTTAADYADARGYVISTLADKYLGTYPDVDHEFQIKGRLAWGDRADRDVVRRMLELQLRMMREDPTGLWRDPCAIQPDGTREYHVRRNSMDRRENAVMFLVTGNIAVAESIWLYVARTKDLAWLGAHIEELEGATTLVEDAIDRQGRLWSDVYYEDQVIKDGRETMSSALAIRSFELLAELEELLGRAAQAAHYRGQAARLRDALAQPLPVGYWDPEAQRFIDWVDRNGDAHDHIHLLANVLPALVGATDPAQSRAVDALVDAELDEFQRFPTFLAARIADYTDSEIGDGGPYDLCAAGRYWCWDAAYWRERGRGDMLRTQLETVAAQGRSDDWVMGERYDMDHVYYVDGSPWHGAAHYYEYPCVFAWVLMHEYLGVRPSLDVDLLIAPRLTEHGAVTLGQDAYRLRYALDDAGFELTNLADADRTFRLELDGVIPGAEPLTVDLPAGATVRVGRDGAVA